MCEDGSRCSPAANEQITRGNPNLLPFRASQVDAGLEFYIDRYSLLSGALFYKSIDSFVARTTTAEKVDAVTFQVTTPTNGKGATVKGFEVNYRQAFRGLPSPLDGLGIQANYTFTESDANYANQVTGTSYGLEGLSKSSYTVVGFYEKYGLQARVAYSWRSRYLAQAQGRNGLPLYFASYGQVDASLMYDINSHLSLSANALNITMPRSSRTPACPSRRLRIASPADGTSSVCARNSNAPGFRWLTAQRPRAAYAIDHRPANAAASLFQGRAVFDPGLGWVTGFKP